MYWLELVRSACSQYWISLLHMRGYYYFTVAQFLAGWLEYSWAINQFEALWVEGGVDCSCCKLNSFSFSGCCFEWNHVHQCVSESRTQCSISRRCGKAVCALWSCIILSGIAVDICVRKNPNVQGMPSCSTLTKTGAHLCPNRVLAT